MIELCRLADEGFPPVAGGVLNQTDAFLTFWSAWNRAQAQVTKAMAKRERMRQLNGQA